MYSMQQKCSDLHFLCFVINNVIVMVQQRAAAVASQ